MATFKESNFRFTDPIRYFKANDPIYYEVDNIPLKQLQENNLWLKDQFEKLEYNQIINNTTNVTNTALPGRSGFSELQPYVTNSDNKVYVRPGRYTARINDVYNLQPLQIISESELSNFSNIINTKTNRDATLKLILDKFITYLQSNAYSMNGLTERAFTRASKNRNELSQFLESSLPRYKTLPPFYAKIPYPSLKGTIWLHNLGATNVEGNIESMSNPLYLPYHENQFVKKWRGLARTSVVDIQSELSIEIPKFDAEDFFYRDETNDRKLLNSATQRIDLLFIYSKPIDASSATIAKFTNNSNTPTKIYAPQLGIVKGAGIGVNLSQLASPQGRPDPEDSVDIQDTNGNQLILPSISDELGQNIGFSGVRGSFPSPDDLLNLAPTLVENLEENNINLLGQSILPIAYIVVKKNAAVNANNAPILTTADVVDIRPFFRTTELTYNERSGLAAAHPQVSLANPVATEFYVDSIARELSTRIAGISNTGSTTTSPTTSLPQNMPRIVYTGKILGGFSWGPELVLFKYIKYTNPSISDNDAYDLLRDKFFYNNIPIVDVFPTWDYSLWAPQILDNNVLAPVDQIGKKLGDYINYLNHTLGTTIQYFGGPSFGMVGGFESRATNAPIQGNVHWVSKEFVLNGDAIPWGKELDIRVNYLNCSPIKTNEKGGIFTTRRKLANGSISLGIHVAWDAVGSTNPADDRNLTGYNKNNFLVLNPEITRSVEGNTAYRGYSNYGTCYLPSVSFDIIAYPEGFRQNEFYTTKNPASTIIQLR